MKLRRSSAALSLAALLAALALLAPGSAAAFSGHKMWGNPVNGKVGHHLAQNPVGLKKYQGRTSSQRGCTWGSVYQAKRGASCTRDLIVSGSLPPGLTFQGCLSLVIAGTPTQPGTWRITLRLPPFNCPEGVTPAQNIEVRFNITGYAPRRVN